MTVTINGSGVVTGVTTLPDGIVTNDDLAGSIAEGKLAGSIPVSKIATTGSASSSTFLSGTGAWASAGGGKLLAYMPTTSAVTLATQASTTSTTYADVSGASVAITPSATSSKILVIANAAINNATGGYSTYVQLVRGSTPIGNGTAVGTAYACFGFFEGSAGSSGSWASNCSIAYIDSPSSTSAVTYKIQMAVNGGTGYIGGASGTGNGTGRSATNITLLELSGV